MPIRFLIDEWESKTVSNHLAFRKIGVRINHYQLMKNMLGLLLEDMTVKQNGARGVSQGLCTSILQADTQLKALEANFNLRQYSMFPSTRNEENTSARNQGSKGGTSSATVNSLGPFHERRNFAKNTTSVKHGCKTIIDAVVATPIQERKPDEPVEEFRRCPIMEEKPKDHVEYTPPQTLRHHIYFTL